MDYWRQQDATVSDLEIQEMIAQCIRDVGLDIARDCGQLREDEPRQEFETRAHTANVRLFAYLKQTEGLPYWRTFCQPAPRRQGGVVSSLLRFLEVLK